MLSRRTFRLSRIPTLRRPRPPNTPSPVPQPRLFTQNSQLLLVARHNPRPQLPYLAQPSLSKRPSPFDQHVLRLLSTETRVYVKDQLWLATRWTAIGWTVLALAGLSYFGWQIESDERSRPTPQEWSFFTRNLVRGARFDREDRVGTGRVDWAKVASSYLGALVRLEEGTDSAGVVAQIEGEGLLIANVGKAGFDLTAKSEQWRAGYYEVLMGCAEAAEQLHDMVLDTTRGLVFPRDVVVGPSNPDPRPVPPYMGQAPREENTAPACEPPEVFYLRVLTSRGFSTQQRLDAAWRYAHWLELQGTSQAAEEMYKWAVDISLASLPSRDTMIDLGTLILKVQPDQSPRSSAHAASPNVLSALKALAIHRARTGDVKSALPILLSILRARRSAPTDLTVSSHSTTKPQPLNPTGLDSIAQSLISIFQTRLMPIPTQTGDEPYTRPSQNPTCEEAELMLYIGEILAASLPASQEGIAWTRQAVTIAETSLETLQNLDADEKAKCRACLSTGVANWEIMLRQFIVASGGKWGSEGKGWRGWFGREEEDGRGNDVEAQERDVGRLKERIAREKVEEDLFRSRGGGGIVWIG